MNQIENNISKESPRSPVPGDILSEGTELYILTYFVQSEGHEDNAVYMAVNLIDGKGHEDNVVYMAVNLIDGNRWVDPTGSIKVATKGLTLVGNVKLTVERIQRST